MMPGLVDPLDMTFRRLKVLGTEDTCSKVLAGIAKEVATSVVRSYGSDDGVVCTALV